MCGTCGCGNENGGVVLRRPGEKEKHEHSHAHSHSHTHHEGHTHSHDHDHSHHHGEARQIQLEKDILTRNNMLAERNRGYFDAKRITALNIISSPGAGKTTLLERSISELKKDEIHISVIEGDQQTTNDADRISATGVSVIQINTGNGCHLDASMISSALKELNPESNSLLLIENVGNLVCPALFDLGEAHRVVLFSVTEGDDKPVKYPTVFENSDICIINKTDLLPYVQFDMKQAKEYCLRINPNLKIFEVSATTGEGIGEWLSWLKETQTAIPI